MTGRDITGECEWFLDCHEESMGIVEHPTLGEVQICGRHIDWLFEDATEGQVNPTKLVPPMAAKHGEKVRSILAKLEEGEEN